MVLETSVLAPTFVFNFTLRIFPAYDLNATPDNYIQRFQLR